MLRPECSRCAKRGTLGVLPANGADLCEACLGQLAAEAEADAMLRDLRQVSSEVIRNARSDEDEDEDEGITEKPRSSGKKRPAKDDDEDAEEDDGGSGKKSGGKKAKGGMGAGMIILIVGVLLTCCICVPGGVGAVFLFGGVNAVRGAAGKVQAINNAKQIAIAQLGYQDANRRFASPKTPNIPGDLSWRVEILPFIEQAPLYQSFDKNVSWDQGKNQPLLSSRPMPYDSPFHPTPDKTQTPWQTFVGPNALFPTPVAQVRMVEIVDGTSNTLLFAESSAPVPWSKVADINVGGGALSLPDGPFIGAFCDGSVRVIDRKKVNDADLRGIINPRDAKGLPPILD